MLGAARSPLVSTEAGADSPGLVRPETPELSRLRSLRMAAGTSSEWQSAERAAFEG